MAYSAGAIVVNTKIDNSQSVRGARAFRGQVNSLTQSVKSASKALAKMSGRALLTGLKKAGSLIGSLSKKMLSFGRETNRGGGMFNLKNMLRYGLGIRSLFVLFNRLRSAIKDGFDTMSKYDGRVKESISTLKTALGGLKGSLASAFAPILTAVAPALTTFIDLLTRAINTVGMFMAAITGQEYYMAAQGVQAIGDAASGSSGSVKELKRQLAGFDELNILSAGGGGGSGSASSQNYTYEKTPVAGGIAAFVQQIKDLFAKGEFEQIGQVIADGINGALDKVSDWISWDNIGPTITKMLTAVTDGINGFFGRFDWSNLGTTIGEGLNTVINTLRLWFKGINWEQIGRGIGDALNNLIKKVDWKALGKLVSEKAGSLISVLKGAVTTIEWGDAGEKLSNALNGFFSNRNLWKDIGDTIDTMLQGVLDFTKRFLVTFDEIEAAKRIRDALGRIDWPTIASKFWETAKTAFQKAGNFLKVLLGGDMYDVNGDAVEQLWDRWNGASSQSYATSLGTKIGTILSDAIKKVFNGIADFVKTEIDWENIGQQLNDFLKGLDWDGIATALWNAIVSVASGFGDLILAALFGKDSKIYEYLNSGNNNGITSTLLGGGALAQLLFRSGGGLSAGTSVIAGNALGWLGEALPWLGALGAVGFAGVATGEYINGLIDATPFGAFLNEVDDYLAGVVLQRYNEYNDNIRDGVTFDNVTGSGIVDVLLWLYGGNDMLYEAQRLNSLPGKDQINDYLNMFANLELPDKYTIGLEMPEKELHDNTNAIKDNTKEIKNATTRDTLSGLASSIVGSLPMDQIKVEADKKRDQFLAEWGDAMVDIGVNFEPNGPGATGYMNNLAGYLAAVFKPGTDTTARVGLEKSKWTTLQAYANANRGGDATAGVGLVKSGWQTLAAFVGTNSTLSALVGLAKSGWSTLSAFVNGFRGGDATEGVGIFKSAWTTLKAFVEGNRNGDATEGVALQKAGWLTVQTFVAGFRGGDTSQSVNLAKNGWTWVDVWAKQYAQTPIDQKVNLKLGTVDSALRNLSGQIIINISGKAKGGIITPGGLSLGFANGGFISGSGARGFWDSIPHYAHGTLFAAGEAGPEVVGHIGGRTEVLNKSQLAQTMQAATYNGMIAALSRVTFRMPAMAGSVLPYDVSAQIAKTGEDIQRTLDANNEDLIQTIISVAAQIVTAVNNRPAPQPTGGTDAQAIINEINRRTRMFGASPIVGV